MVTPDSSEKLKVFISYSRRDGAFADRLVEALKGRGFDVRIDRRDLPKLEDWKRELTHLIRQADTVILIVSRNSLSSPVVAWEVDQVRGLGKRLAPVVISDLADLAVPADVSRINYALFSDPSRFETNVDELATALTTDSAWLKDHTRLNELALRWADHGKPGDMTIRGRELAEAEAWVERHPRDMPPVTSLQREFLAASRNTELERNAREARQRKARLLLLAALLMLFVASLGYAGWSNRPFVRSALTGLLDRIRNMALSPVAERALKPLDTFSECQDCPEMIVVPPGEFMMGSPAAEKDRDPHEDPYHHVKIANAFAVSKYEITFAQWETCVALAGCTYEPMDLNFGRGSHPVINIGWDDARQYTNWLAKRTGRPYRLLSEAEWEYAARAGSQTSYPWGDAIETGRANCGGCGTSFDNKSTAPVGSFAPNAFGLYDMIGNVWEWVEDCWHDGYEGAPVDGSAWITDCSDDALRVLRGGSWDDKAADVRSAARFGPGVSARTRVNGIRIGRSLQQ
jgi:formylglycine-generating enzyme required for sulfatase activity